MKNKALFVAHPDDEVLFFSGPLYTFGKDFHVVLVTDGNADGLGKSRLKEFELSLESFNVDSFELYN
ncbi:MAG: PIG-L family deacetylase, partial [Halobacteriovoraceae bacterium]|nr:PIG-L family deacetylase [Halobacteriovoraceae bacterium]